MLLPFVCSYFRAAFPSRRQLSAHKQRAHNWRKPIGNFIDDSGICCACGVKFADRLRVLNHVATRSCGTTISKWTFLNQSLPNFCVKSCLKTGNFGSKPGMKVGLSRMLVNPSETRVDSTSVCSEWRVDFGGPVCCELFFLN